MKWLRSISLIVLLGNPSACDLSSPDSARPGNGSRAGDRTPPETVISSTFTVQDSVVLDRLNAWKSRLLGATDEWFLGSLDGDDLETFGQVYSAASSGDRLYVADRVTQSLKVYTHAGDAVAEPLTFGDGPREMRGVLAAAPISEQTIAVADPTQLRFFDVVADSLMARNTVPIGAAAQGACALAGRAYVRTWRRRTNQIVARFGEEPGDTLFFGDGAQFTDENTRNQLSRGHIACSETASIVAVAFDSEPFIRAYSPDGELVWQARIEPFSRSDMALGKSTGSNPSAVDRGRLHDQVIGMVTLPPDAFLVNVIQVQSVSPGSRPTYLLGAYIVDAATGNGGIVDGFKDRVLAASSERYFSVRSRPEGFEQIVSHRFP
jgi:hypothetical protein